MRNSSRWTPVALLACAILVVSIIPVPGAVPEEGGGVPTSLLFHVVGYAALAVATGYALLAPGDRARALVAGTGGAGAYGTLIECVQYPIAYRTFSYLDMLVNAGGAALGALVLLCVLLIRGSDDHR